MKRSSIVGPLLLIAIGALFLANNIRPDISVMDIIARFWPFVLIGWGAVRLLEILFWAMTRKPLPASGISGGEWTLVVFITLIGSGVYIVNKNVGWWSPMHIRVKGVEVFGEQFDFPLKEQTIAVGKPIRVVLEHRRGHARITGADTTEVKVTGRKMVRAMEREQAEKADTSTPVELISKAGSLLIRTNQDRSQGERFVWTDLEITVPRSATVEVHGTHGDFDIAEIDGSVEVDSDNAGVRLQTIGGSVTVDTRRSDIIRAVGVKGNVELKGRGNDVELENVTGQVVIAGLYTGELQFRQLAKPLRLDDENKMQSDIRVERTPGELRIGRGHINGDNLIGPIVINAQSKDVQLSEFTESATITINKGDVELRPGRLPVPKLEIITRSGNVDVALPEGGAFSIQGTAERGEVHNDFGAPLNVEEFGRRSVIRGTVGKGPALSLSTERGSVTVRKGSVITTEPLPAEKI